MPRPHLAYVLEATSGGAKRHVMDALTGLAQRGWNCTLYFCDRRADPTFAQELRALHHHGVRVRRIAMATNPLALTNLRAARSIAHDLADHAHESRVILHGHSSIGGACARMAAGLFPYRSRPIATFYTPHTPATQFNQWSRSRRYAYLSAEIILARWTTAIVAVGQDEYRHIRTWPIHPTRCLHIPNGIAAHQIRPPPASANRSGLLWVGRLSGEKDPLAAIHLVAKTPHATLTIAGDGPLFAAAQTVIAQLEVGNRITLLGHVDDPGPLYDQARCLLLTSHYEGLPYVALEAMAHGCAVAGLDAPGVTPLLQGTGNLVLARIRAQEQADTLITWLMHDADHVGRRNRHQVLERFTLHGMLANLERLYLISSQRSR